MNYYIAYNLSIIVWALLTYFIYRNGVNFKITRNYTSIIHATTILLFFTFNLSSSYLFPVTFGYYIFDGLLEVYGLIKTRRLYNLGMIFHHIISCYILSYLLDPVVEDYLRYSFFTIEVSNYPIYLVYHLKSIKYNNEIVIRLLIICEALSFLFFRMFLCGISIYDSIMSGLLPYPPIICGVAIYTMSAVWLYGMILQITK